MIRYTTTLQDAIQDRRVLAARDFLAARKAEEERAHRAAYRAELRARLAARKAAG